MDIFEWDESIPVTVNNLNEMQNIINNNIVEESARIRNWNYLGSTTADGTINLPSSFNEILCIIKIDNNSALQLLIQVPYIHLTSSSQSFNSGYYGSSSVSGYARAVISRTSGNLSNAYQNGTFKLSTTVAMWYYR